MKRILPLLLLLSCTSINCYVDDKYYYFPSFDLVIWNHFTTDDHIEISIACYGDVMHIYFDNKFFDTFKGHKSLTVPVFTSFEVDSLYLNLLP